MARSHQHASSAVLLLRRLAQSSGVACNNSIGSLSNGFVLASASQGSGYNNSVATAAYNGFRYFSKAAASSAAAAASSSLNAASATVASTTARGARSPKNSLINDLKQLSKFRLSSLVVLTASAGFVAGSGDAIDWASLAWTSLGTFGAAACANSLNQLYEINNDRLMTRTCNRPLPSGRMRPLTAAAFALTMGAAGLGILHFQTNPTTTALGAANILLYAAVYTPLKQISVVNTWVGAVVGAIPPLMGWAAASGQLDIGASVLAAALFSWQMPHFLALAWLCKDDYIRGGFSMLSKFDAVGRRTGFTSLRHCLYLAPIGLLAYWAEVTAEAFAWEAAALAAFFGVYAAKFALAPSQGSARKMFKASLLYLPLLMTAMVLHRLPNHHEMDAEAVCAKARSALEGYPSLINAAAAVEQIVGGVLGMGTDLWDHLFSSPLKCPSKVLCEEEEEAKGASSSEAGEKSQEQAMAAAVSSMDKLRGAKANGGAGGMH